MSRALLLAGCLLVTACSPSPTAAPVQDNATPAAPPQTGRSVPATAAFDERAFLGRWRGVEGMYLDVGKSDRAGRYRLEMQWDLDHHGVFVGEAAAPGLAFTRAGEELTLRRTDGDATGLKYLAGKRDCLTVKPGEGYCRD